MTDDARQPLRRSSRPERAWLVSAPQRRGLSIDAPSVADPHHENAQRVILNRDYDPIVPDAIFPERPQLAVQSFAYAPWIIQGGDPLVQKSQDAFCDLAIELVEFTFGRAFELNPPRHSASLGRQAQQ